MLSVIESMLAAFLPVLIREAEVLIGGPVPDDSSWIVGLVKEITSLFKSKLPGWIQPSEAELEKLVEQLVQKYLPKA